MAKYRKKPVVIEAEPWFRNGDHPEDHDPMNIKDPTNQDRESYCDYLSSEGKIVRYFCRPDVEGTTICPKCKRTMNEHGWIDTPEDGHVVCPGDWIITGVKGERYPCKPDIFKLTYELV